jgi:hypothetical protein
MCVFWGGEPAKVTDAFPDDEACWNWDFKLIHLRVGE